MNPNVFEILAVSSVRALIGGTRPRIYRQGMAPQGVAGPYLTWYVLDGQPQNALDEAPRVDRVEVQVEIFSANDGNADDEELETLADTLRDALEIDHDITQFSDGGQDAATQRYRKILRFTVWNSR